MGQLKLFDCESVRKPVNVASVPMRSPFRYAGGKTWLIPEVRRWLKSLGANIELIEPFAGGGIVGLTAAFENLAQKIVLVEKDEDVAAVWRTLFGKDAKWLVDSIIEFDVSYENANQFMRSHPHTIRERAFLTILRNRLCHGGILAEGAGLIKRGENGKGLRSRWYPQTLKKRILDIQHVKDHIVFIEGDGFEVIRDNANKPNTAFFIDPPYVKAGKRLYRHFEVNHEYLFEIAACIKGHFLMTYDDAEEIRLLATKHGFDLETVPMKTTHHETKMELLISRDLTWLREWFAGN
jgi:DNA adenine methylase